MSFGRRFYLSIDAGRLRWRRSLLGCWSNLLLSFVGRSLADVERDTIESLNDNDHIILYHKSTGGGDGLSVNSAI